MGDIVNLRRVRKAKARAQAATAAEANRQVHGRTKAERDAGAQQRAVTTRALDRARIERD